jgi:lipid-A-disaccharide synthase
VRYFFSTGEPSGETSALLLADAIARIDDKASFEGIGAERMRAAGFRIWRDHTGWASMGPLAALPRIPKLLAIMWRTALHIKAVRPDLVVLVDYGVFNLRLAQTLRRLRYAGAILDVFPPGTWLDNAEKARVVSSVSVPLTAFAHQYEFYRSLELPIAYFGHPLTGQYRMRPLRAAPPGDGGTVALLPGSRGGELRRHLPALASAYRMLQSRRPNLQGVFGAAGEPARAQIARAVATNGLRATRIVDGVAPALAEADAAWVASGTAVLECALSGVPAVAFYIISPLLVKHGQTMIKHRFITLPNLVLKREVVPELLQEAATPERLAAEMERVLAHPAEQYGALGELRTALGPDDALERCASFAVGLAKGTAA